MKTDANHVPKRSRTKKTCPKSPLELLKNHYGSTIYHRTPEQLEREKYLIPKFVKFNRWALIPAAVIIQFCCGSLYAWSVYNDPIENYIYGQQRNTAQITFYLAIGCLGISAALSGPWLERNGPSKAAYLGTAGFFLANLLAATAVYTKQMWLLYLGYGIIGGCSIGICYISPVSALQKFFPDRRGMASGFAVCGFGAGSIAATPLQLLLIEKVGVPLTFVILGGSYFSVMIVASAVLRTPPNDYDVTSEKQPNGSPEDPTSMDTKDASEVKIQPRSHIYMQFTLIEALRSRDYRLMFVMFFGNLVPGLVIVSSLSTTVQALFDKSKNDGAFVVAVNGGFNLAGRFIFSLLSDKVGRKTVFLVSLATQATILGCMVPILKYKDSTYWVFASLIWILAACFGCSFAVIPAFLTDMFGATNIGACYGVILMGWSLAGVGGGLLYTGIFNSLVPRKFTATEAYPYLLNFYWLLAIVLIAFVATIFIRTNDMHRFLAKTDQRRAFYFSISPRLLIFKCGQDSSASFVKCLRLNEVVDECEKRFYIAEGKQKPAVNASEL